jgi:hypothetical protein
MIEDVKYCPVCGDPAEKVGTLGDTVEATCTNTECGTFFAVRFSAGEVS